ncbi:MAG: M14-type cytosolic carboxypeptidase [Ignavibacteria bacterium]|nr:M14-type cytosolic carboxypeptidase [Ignavibacteria bacterium]
MKKYYSIFLVLILIVSAKGQVIFEANFDSGNLQSVTTTDSINFTVRVNADIVGRWFYFRMRNVKNRYVSVTIQNSDATRPMYSYDNKNWIRFTETESPQRNVFRKTYTQDTVYVAYYVPYSVTQLHEKINLLKNNPYVKIDTIGFSEQNRPLIVLTITDFTTPDTLKFYVWAHGRTHPSETPSSYHLDGMINYLLSDDEVAVYLRTKIKLIVLPFINPDGVYLGKSRVNANNIDLERSWNLTPSQTPKEVFHTKNYLQNILAQRRIHVALNMHSQVANFATFWIHTASSTSDYFYRKQLQFANLQSSNSNFIKPADYSYSNLQPYFPEGWFWSNWGDQIMALTYETPYTRFSDGTWIDNSILDLFGKQSVLGIMEYLGINHEKRFIVDNDNAIVFGNWNLSTSNSFWNYYGESFLYILPNELNHYVEWTSPILKSGKYYVYAMWQDLATAATDAEYQITTSNYFKSVKVNQQQNGGLWYLLDSVSIPTNNQIKVRLLSKGNGTITADAVRIIYAGSLTNIEREFSPLEDFSLSQNYPNPFNSKTKIQFSILTDEINPQTKERVILKVYDILGREIATLKDDYLSSGVYEIDFDVSRLSQPISSGIYFAKLFFKEKSQTIKMVYLK